MKRNPLACHIFQDVIFTDGDTRARLHVPHAFSFSAKKHDHGKKWIRFSGFIYVLFPWSIKMQTILFEIIICWTLVELQLQLKMINAYVFAVRVLFVFGVMLFVDCRGKSQTDILKRIMEGGMVNMVRNPFLRGKISAPHPTHYHYSAKIMMPWYELEFMFCFLDV